MNGMPTLLEKAREQIQPERAARKLYTQEEIELAVAWLNGTVTNAQVVKTVPVKCHSLQQWAVARVRSGIRRGIVSVAYVG